MTTHHVTPYATLAGAVMAHEQTEATQQTYTHEQTAALAQLWWAFGLDPDTCGGLALIAGHPLLALAKPPAPGLDPIVLEIRE